MKADARQTGAVTERIGSDARHVFRNGDARQTGTVGKRIILNARHAVRNFVCAGNAAGAADQ